MVPHTDDGRVLFVIPWHGRALVGTTDTAMPEPQMEPRPLPEEIEFILRNAGRYLATDPKRSDVLCAFAGQRPLVRVPGKTATKELSRSHEVLISKTGLVTIVGGKWTTYRRMAQDTVDRVIEVGGLPPRPCATEALRLHGWKPSDPAAPADPLALYGTDAEAIEGLMREEPELREPLDSRLPYPRGARRLGRAARDGAHRRGRPVAPDPQPPARRRGFGRRGAGGGPAPRPRARTRRRVGVGPGRGLPAARRRLPPRGPLALVFQQVVKTRAVGAALVAAR